MKGVSMKTRMIVDPFEGMSPIEIENAKRARETPEQTNKRHEEERRRATEEGVEARRQRDLGKLSRGSYF